MNGQKLFSWLCKEAFIQRSHLFAGSWGFHTLDYLSRSAPLIRAVLFVLPVNEFSQYEIAYLLDNRMTQAAVVQFSHYL